MLELVLAKAVDFALTETLSETYRRIMEGRVSRAREILIEELRTANVDLESAAESDETVGMLIAFAEAVRQNAAFRNLRLMAQVLAHKTVHADARKDDFLMWADVIGGLLPEEVIALATIQKHAEAAEAKTDRPSQAHRIVKQGVLNELVGSGRMCTDNEQFQAIGGALLRTGCLVPIVEDGVGMSFYPSFRMKEFARMARLQEAADEILSDMNRK